MKVVDEIEEVNGVLQEIVDTTFFVELSKIPPVVAIEPSGCDRHYL